MTYEEIIKLVDERIELFLKLFERDFWDIAAIIAPLLLSVVAIFISVYAIRKQTKSDLFEKRYAIIHVLGFLVEGSKNILLNTHIAEKDFWKMGMYNYKDMNSLPNSVCEDDNVLNFYYNLMFQIMKINCLFPERKIKHVNEFNETFMTYISNLFLDKDTKNDKILLGKYIDLMEQEKILEKIDKYLKIW